MATRKITLADRFWSKVNKTDTCWYWTAQRNNKGYGRFQVFTLADRPNGSRMQYAHRVSYEMAYGQIPNSMNVLHSCDNPACVRPIHLRIGTQSENMRESSAKRRLYGAAWASARAKVTWEQVQAIRSDGRPQRTIAREYGLSQTYVSDLKLMKCRSRGV